MKTIRLRDGKERSLLRRHPWVFDGAVARGGADAGETVRVEAADGRFLAWGAYSGASRIRVRAWSFVEAERIDAAFFAGRVERAVALRARLPIDSDAVRLVHGEADGLPGLVVDRYGGLLCAQFGSAGVERHKAVLADALLRATGCTRLYERSDASVRALEGLPAVTGWLRGAPAVADEPVGPGDSGAAAGLSGPADAGTGADRPAPVVGTATAGPLGRDAATESATEVAIVEHGRRLTVDVAGGHKTGYYLDQRDNREHLARWVRRLGCRDVLNAFCYTGGFTVAALAGGAATVTSVDSSAPALARVQRHVADNGFDAARSRVVDGDVNAFLRAAVAAGRRWDAIVLDPPKFAPTAAHAERAARAYKDINRLALMALAPGGLLMTFSCSGGIGAELFHKIVAGAALDAGVDGAVVQRLQAAPDHPTTLTFPEGEYLKGLAIVRDGTPGEG